MSAICLCSGLHEQQNSDTRCFGLAGVSEFNQVWSHRGDARAGEANDHTKRVPGVAVEFGVALIRHPLIDRPA